MVDYFSSQDLEVLAPEFLCWQQIAISNTKSDSKPVAVQSDLELKKLLSRCNLTFHLGVLWLLLPNGFEHQLMPQNTLAFDTMQFFLQIAPQQSGAQLIEIRDTIPI